MYYQSSARPNDPPEPESDRLKTLLDNLNNLRGKLKNFTVIDELGQPIGEISDLILDAGHQLNLVLAQPDTQEPQSSVLLNGRRIKKVSVQTQSVFVDITKADVRFLPEYVLPEELASEQPKQEEPLEPHISQQAPVETWRSPDTPDFSLDVMEAPAVSAPAPTNEALDFLDLPDSTRSNEASDFLELEAPTDDVTRDSLGNDDDLFGLEVSNEAASLDEIGFLDTATASEAEDLADFALADETVEPITLAEQPELGVDSDTATSNNAEEWAEFDRIMAIEPEAPEMFNLNGNLDDSADINPLPEEFSLVDGLLDTDSSSDALLPESFALEEPEASSSADIELPEFNLDEGSTTNLSSPDDLTDLDFTIADNSSDLSLEQSENLASLDLEAESAIFDLGEPELPELTLGEPESLSSLEFSTEEDLPELPELSLSSETSDNLADLDFTLESPEPSELSLGEPESLSSLEFSTEENLPELPELSLSSETSDNLADLDFTLESPEPSELSLGEPESLSSLEFSAEENLPELPELSLGSETSDNLADLDFTLESPELPELTLGEPENNLSSLEFSAEEDLPELPELSLGSETSDNLADLDFTLESPEPSELSLGEPESLSSLEFSTEENLSELPEFSLGESDNFSAPEVGVEAEMSGLELASDESFSSFDLNSPDESFAEDLTSSSLLETPPENDMEAEWAEFDREMNPSADELSSLEPSLESLEDLPELNLGDFEQQPETVAPDLTFNLEDSNLQEAELSPTASDSRADELSDTDTFASLDFDNEAESLSLDLGMPDLDLAPDAELTSSDLVGDTDEIVFTEDDESSEEDDLSAISSLADLDFTPETTEPESLDFAEFGEAPAFNEPETSESFTLDESESLPELTLAAEPEAADHSDEASLLDLDFGESPELQPELNLADLSTSAEATNLDIDHSLQSDTSTEMLGFAADLPEPPTINLDALELSDVPVHVASSEPLSVADHTTTDESFTESGTANQPEFGLASIPAETYDLPGHASSEESLQTPELQDVTTTVPDDTVDAIVPLLEERLKVEYERRKVGEVIVRKRIETRMVQVPVRYEKLVIEQVGDEPKTLAEVDLSQGALDNLELPNLTGSTRVSGEFKSARTASYVLDAIAKTLRQRCKSVRIEIELDDPKLQKAYQDWLNQCSQIE